MSKVQGTDGAARLHSRLQYLSPLLDWSLLLHIRFLRVFRDSVRVKGRAVLIASDQLPVGCVPEYPGGVYSA